jgi:1-acyl-sn-glycerol-3-phosphate acyltransferase
MIRTALAALFLTLYTLILGPPLILYTVVTGHVGPLYTLGVGGVVFIVRLIGVRIRVEGLGNIPRGVCLFVANHTSTADAPAVVGAIPRRVSIMAKESLFKIPIVGQAFRAAKFVPVNRSDRESAIASVEKAIEYIREGASFLIYPEGSRSDDGRLQAFKKGAFVMAIKAGVPIVPVACSGAHLVMRKRELRLRPGEILVRFCPPVDAAKYTMEERDALSRRVHAAMAEGLPPEQRPLESVETESQEGI